ncbi:Proteasome subunit alpha type-6 [Massospora cicadina]|nr:Proteasome subunit alpha type-6 [Massospora cicadina]
MFRNQYDNDVTKMEPARTHAVLVALKRAPHELASYQKKIIVIDDHIAIAIAGLTSDARVLSNYMRTEAMKSKMLYNRPLPVSRIVQQLGDKAQANTQGYSGRPYGVGFLVIGQDETGPHLFEANPAGSNFEYFAMSIGSRSQSAKTYLERHFQIFDAASKEELIRHALQALHDTLPKESNLTTQNVSIAIIGPDAPLELLEDEAVEPFLANLDVTTVSEGAEVSGAAMDES